MICEGTIPLEVKVSAISIRYYCSMWCSSIFFIYCHKFQIWNSISLTSFQDTCDALWYSYICPCVKCGSFRDDGQTLAIFSNHSMSSRPIGIKRQRGLSHFISSSLPSNPTANNSSTASSSPFLSFHFQFQIHIVWIISNSIKIS
jgi:hypothetical protein